MQPTVSSVSVMAKFLYLLINLAPLKKINYYLSSIEPNIINLRTYNNATNYYGHYSIGEYPSLMDIIYRYM